MTNGSDYRSKLKTRIYESLDDNSFMETISQIITYYEKVRKRKLMPRKRLEYIFCTCMYYAKRKCPRKNP